MKRSRKGAPLKPGVSEFTWLIGSEGFCYACVEGGRFGIVQSLAEPLSPEKPS